ncbi:MAG TPA: glucuronate isomerase [Saprospiraceae bacterium]|nr:glucuronate isomerase [Saprospiraceae bacterium]
MDKKSFITDDFLLRSKTAIRLFHEYARNLPIIDFHSHLPSDEIAMNLPFRSVTHVWLEGDHYKWRAMRAFGIKEKFITGDSSDYEKFHAWASTVPATLRNPLFHWTYLELNRYFNLNCPLNKDNSQDIYKITNEMAKSDDFKPHALLNKMNVEVVCTSDDPVDKLNHHQKVNGDNHHFKVLPTWRPDQLFDVENPQNYTEYLQKLTEATGCEINTFDDLINSLEMRQLYFHKLGCRLADHGLKYFYSQPFTDDQLRVIFKKLKLGKNLTWDESETYLSGITFHLCALNNKMGWKQQFHVGPIRNTNPKMYKKLGSNTGFDSIGSSQKAENMVAFFSRLEDADQLAPSILYNSNPNDNYMFAGFVGNYQNGSNPQKMQYGPAWWFLDQKEGIELQLNAYSYTGLLSRFIGMVTDSRSFLSYPRHEYFRRILCNLLGNEMEEGLLPNDEKMIGGMIQNICYYNAKDYFKF